MIRPARFEDAPAIARVHVQSWREAYPGIISDATLKNLSLEARVGAWKENLSPGYQGPRFNFVAEDHARGIVGFASGGPRRSEAGELPALKAYEGELMALYLLKDFQKKGVGRALFEAIRAKLKSGGMGSMMVWVLKANPTLHFYRHLGGLELGSKLIMIDREHEEAALGWERI